VSGPTPDAFAVLCRGVTKTYGKGDNAVVALRGADLECRYGQMTYLVGPSGCGKTTLISILAGLVTPDGGELRVLGDDLRAFRRGALTRWRSRNVGFIFQAFNLIPQLTIAENVAVPLVIRGERVSTAVEKAKALLARVGLAGREHSRPGKLSGGQQQRVAIARSLVHDPRILVCDEPTSALDVSVQSQILNLLGDLQKEFGLSYLFISHDMAVVHHICDRIAVMWNGRIVEEGDRDRIINRPEHSYTRALLSAVPEADPRRQKERVKFEGMRT
jgi:putative ABC transport system ATP-binding protein